MLERYATALSGVEINSSFYRSHRLTTYERWAAAVPDDFRFAVKVPKTITHERRLSDCEQELSAFAEECRALGKKFAIALVQLPPSLAFNLEYHAFFTALRSLIAGDVVCEPRHASWFNADVERWLVEQKIARVAADPALHPSAGEPGGWTGVTYRRLHGSPVVYRSSYDVDVLHTLARDLANDSSPRRWCVFDNTASSAALQNALTLAALQT